ncbi:MAG: restriction endonuclease [Anaerolineae bacterium]|nr:restriction endonuclease [Anaerolineae bacterium]
MLVLAMRVGKPSKTQACQTCGWWNTYHQWHSIGGEDGAYWWMDGAIGQLRNFDFTDLSTPFDEVSRYLIARYEARFNVHPRIFENVVASVFRNIGYETEVTAYQNDGGIDVVLRSSNNERTAIQVKRYRNRIGVEQIRGFTGALFINGITKGIFLTTSSFSRGSKTAAEQSSVRGIPIELLDAQRFYNALGIAQRPAYESYDDWYEQFGDIETVSIFEKEGPY